MTRATSCKKQFSEGITVEFFARTLQKYNHSKLKIQDKHFIKKISRQFVDIYYEDIMGKSNKKRIKQHKPSKPTLSQETKNKLGVLAEMKSGTKEVERIGNLLEVVSCF